MASAMRCTAAGSSRWKRASSKPSRMFRVSTSAMPPEDGGGKERISRPR
jgi:hypothetical protein